MPTARRTGPASPTSLPRSRASTARRIRVMGRERPGRELLQQTRVEVLPTRTIYEFAGAGVKLESDLLHAGTAGRSRRAFAAADVYGVARSSADGAAHEVARLLRRGAELVVNTADQPVRGVAIPVGWPAGAAHGVAGAAGAGETRRRSADRLGLPVPGRRSGRGRHATRGDHARRARRAFETQGSAARRRTISTDPCRGAGPALRRVAITWAGRRPRRCRDI